MDKLPVFVVGFVVGVVGRVSLVFFTCPGVGDLLNQWPTLNVLVAPYVRGKRLIVIIV